MGSNRYSRTFYYHRSFGVPKKYQQYIWAKCRLYHSLRRQDRAEIDEIITAECEPYGKEIFRLLTTDTGIELVAMDGYVSVGTIRNHLKKFYRAYYERIKKACE